MTIDKRTSIFIDSQVPSYLHREGPKFVAFLKAYYEWMEQSNNSIDISRNIKNYIDIDNTTDKYLEYFHNQIMKDIPKNVLVNRKLLAKHIKSIYKTKGTEESYKLLFRILYDEEIELFYPNDVILRASDGVWVEETSLRISEPIVGDLTSLEGELIEGTKYGSRAKVEKILQTKELGVPLIELYISNVSGVFEDEEEIQSLDGSVKGTIFATSGPLQSVVLKNKGSGHVTGDRVTITSNKGSGAAGVITGVSDTSAVEFSISSGGTGYRLSELEESVVGGSGALAEFEITSVANNDTILLNNDIIGPMANVVLNTSPTFVSAGANTSSVSANLATANINSVLSSALDLVSTPIGSLSGINTIDSGYGYDSSLPTASVIDSEIFRLTNGELGGDAVIDVNYTDGSISEIIIDSVGVNYQKFEEADIVNTTRIGTEDATGIVLVSGVVNYPGKYVDTRGWLSWNNRLQDNRYYQQFSYDIRSTQAYKAYEKIVKTLLHTAGTEAFGTYNIVNDIEFPTPTIETEITTETS